MKLKTLVKLNVLKDQPAHIEFIKREKIAFGSLR